MTILQDNLSNVQLAEEGRFGFPPVIPIDPYPIYPEDPQMPVDPLPPKPIYDIPFKPHYINPESTREIPVNLPSNSNKNAGMITGGMEAGGSVTSGNFDWYNLLNALGFTKGGRIPVEGSAPMPQNLPAPQAQYASAIPFNFNSNILIGIGFIIVIIFLLKK